MKKQRRLAYHTFLYILPLEAVEANTHARAHAHKGQRGAPEERMRTVMLQSVLNIKWCSSG